MSAKVVVDMSSRLFLDHAEAVETALVDFAFDITRVAHEAGQAGDLGHCVAQHGTAEAWFARAHPGLANVTNVSSAAFASQL